MSDTPHGVDAEETGTAAARGVEMGGRIRQISSPRDISELL